MRRGAGGAKKQTGRAKNAMRARATLKKPEVSARNINGAAKIAMAVERTESGDATFGDWRQAVDAVPSGALTATGMSRAR